MTALLGSRGRSSLHFDTILEIRITKIENKIFDTQIPTF